jgi:hypothetical protein
MQNNLWQILKVDNRDTLHPWDNGWNERGKKIEMYSIDHVFQKRQADWGKRAVLITINTYYNKD